MVIQKNCAIAFNPTFKWLNIVSDCRNCTICDLETTFNSPEPKVCVRKWNHSPLSVDFALEYPLETHSADRPKRYSTHLSIVSQNYSILLAHISTSACGYYFQCCFLIALILLLLAKYYWYICTKILKESYIYAWFVWWSNIEHDYYHMRSFSITLYISFSQYSE